MYTVKKTVVISASHELELPYDSKCKELHGHNFKITAWIRAEGLNENGMVVDFSLIKSAINVLDHTHINDFIKQPTAENIAKWLCGNINSRSCLKQYECYRVDVEENEGSMATYEK